MSHTFTFLTSAPPSKAPTITIRKGGMLALNEGALKMLGDEVAFVQLGYDETKKAIGLRAAGEGSTGRYRLRKQTKSQARLVDGKRLFALHGLSVENIRVSGLLGGRALADEEIARLFKTCSDDSTPKGARDAAMLAVFYGCGI